MFLEVDLFLFNKIELEFVLDEDLVLIHVFEGDAVNVAIVEKIGSLF